MASGHVFVWDAPRLLWGVSHFLPKFCSTRGMAVTAMPRVLLHARATPHVPVRGGAEAVFVEYLSICRGCSIESHACQSNQLENRSHNYGI